MKKAIEEIQHVALGDHNLIYLQPLALTLEAQYLLSDTASKVPIRITALV